MRILTLWFVLATVSSSGFEDLWNAFLAPNWVGTPMPHADLELVIDEWVVLARLGEQSSSTTTTEAPTTTTDPPQSLRRERLVFADLKEGPSEPVIVNWVPMRLADTVIASMSPTVRDLVHEQALLDEKEMDSCPLIHHADQITRINGVRQRLVFDRQIARQQFSTLFLTTRSPNQYVVKYQCDCEEVLGIHPLLRDFWFLRALNQTDIAPKVYYVSPAVRWTSPLTAKTDFTLSDTEKRACMQNSSIRYLVMARGVASMYQVVKHLYKGPIRFLDAMFVMDSLIEKIQRMHSFGIIHGDIHPGNVMLMRKDRWEIGLIDFGSAMFQDELATMPTYMHRPMSYVHSYFSHWNVEGFRFSYRDDVFKALYVGAYLLNGDGYTEYMRQLERSATEMIQFKKFSFMFTFPGGRDILSGLSVDQANRARIFGHLDRALGIARAVDQLDGFPDYAGIVTELRHAAHIVRHL